MKTFEITHNGITLKGVHSKVSDSTSSLVMITGMQEHSRRYKDFAEYLNQYKIDVYVLDHFGQGENVSKVEDLQKWPKDAFTIACDMLREQIKKVKTTKKHPVYLMGHSCGSFVCQMYLERHPATADKVVLMGSGKPGNAFTMGLAYMFASLIVNRFNWNKKSKLLSKMALGPYSKAIKDAKTPLDWLSKNEENVKIYMDDPMCGAQNTNGFWKGFFKGLKELYKKKNIKKISPKDRILLVSGADDPVGGMSKGVTALYEMYRNRGVKDVTLKLYPTLRHEILNEKENDEVYRDIKDFLLSA